MTLEDPALERARKRAKELRKFYGHVITYVLVCSVLLVIDLANDDPNNPQVFIGLNWAFWPILGWGAFVVIDGISTFIDSDRWEERKAQKLYEKEKQRDLPQH